MEVTLHPNSESAFKAEAEDVEEQRKIRAELLKRKAEAEERKQKKSREGHGCSEINVDQGFQWSWF